MRTINQSPQLGESVLANLRAVVTKLQTDLWKNVYLTGYENECCVLAPIDPTDFNVKNISESSKYCEKDEYVSVNFHNYIFILAWF